MVYIISKDGNPLMPTERHGKVRRLLRDKKAKVIKRTPFTIQLLYETGDHVQPVTLGVDAGSKVVGLSATTEDKELYAAELELRNDIVDKLSTRRTLRRFRRNRKTRYRKPRFDNRVASKKKGWLAPSVRHKIETHLTAIESVHEILPVEKIVVEVAQFDIAKIKNPEIEGTEYQQGEQLGFWNVREYVLFRDNHTCQHCKGKSRDPILNVHHLESRKTGGNAPNNLITLCETCHKAHHKGEIKLKQRRGTNFRDAAFMGIMRWALYDELKARYPNVRLTYGYITKNTRIRLGLPKGHAVDAYCIAGNTEAVMSQSLHLQRKVRCHNRQIHKLNSKKGYRRKNQAPYIVHGLRLFDKVAYEGKEYFVFGRRQSGYMDCRTLTGEKLRNGSISHKRLTFLEPRKNILESEVTRQFLPTQA